MQLKSKKEIGQKDSIFNNQKAPFLSQLNIQIIGIQNKNAN
ncbi:MULTISPECIES: hypothetical protein [Leptospira]|uniref:Uncharacterized protein n=1 Tax=Leptospira weilii str. UI 13098 TaxID=1088542 RepID=M6QKG0_9LEPT|nr:MULTISPECIES: hypothetical protein [Leptospira]EMN89377.1 hypothetical protein LEP1GSC108_0323 [Leptospira weilii str. UI 13098]